MPDYEQLLECPPFGLTAGEKGALFDPMLTRLTALHRARCAPYDRLLKAMGCGEHTPFTRQSVPMLPVSLFKQMDLRSIPEEEIFKVITSSGTSGQQVSRICLDAATSARQQKTLSRIVSHLIGPGRLPMLVIDSRQVLRNRAMFSARGAGILGFSLFGSPVCYALDDEMRLDLPAVEAFLEKHRGRRILLFGFTYMVWKHFCLALEELGRTLPIQGGVLIHGGGWKKLAGQAVSPQEFRARLRAVAGLEIVADYYGMAEQTGCICLQCPQGHLHVSSYSDILIRRVSDYGVCPPGEPGVIQVLSPLPESYPGHSLLTEDTGVLLGEDDCPCGWKGKYFTVTGRLPRAEVRGCSDTYGG